MFTRYMSPILLERKDFFKLLFITALLVPTGTQLELSWLLLGSHFGLDAHSEVFLLFTALLWLIAGPV